MTDQTLEQRIAVPLLILRVTLGIFLLQWGVDKLVDPGHTAAVFSHFYFFDGLDVSVANILGVLQIVLCVGLILGFMRNITYLIAFLIHSVSTISTWKHLVMPWMFEGWSALFMTGVPVLAAFWLLYSVREWDVLSMDGKKAARTPAA